MGTLFLSSLLEDLGGIHLGLWRFLAELGTLNTDVGADWKPYFSRDASSQLIGQLKTCTRVSWFRFLGTPFAEDVFWGNQKGPTRFRGFHFETKPCQRTIRAFLLGSQLLHIRGSVAQSGACSNLPVPWVIDKFPPTLLRLNGNDPSATPKLSRRSTPNLDLLSVTSSPSPISVAQNHEIGPSYPKVRKLNVEMWTRGVSLILHRLWGGRSFDLAGGGGDLAGGRGGSLLIFRKAFNLVSCLCN